MIEIKFLPVFGVMAFITLLTEIAFVRVLFAMTVEAAGWGFRELLIRLMASCTGYIVMAALKMEIRIIVVEGRTIHNSDTGIPANMVGMAYLAGGLCDFGFQPMKTLTSQEISIDLFVAVAAELRLCVLLEACMTTGTLALVLCVSLDNFARHQQGFDISSVGCVHE
jgi:hypothetical protein